MMEAHFLENVIWSIFSTYLSTYFLFLLSLDFYFGNVDLLQFYLTSLCTYLM